MRKFVVITTLIVVLILSIFIWWRYFFVFGTGVKDGTLNFVVKKGYVFKTWEGRVIQTGIRSNQGMGVQSNEFEFSVKDERIAEQLQVNSGKYFVLHYKEYLGAWWWRGNSKYVVDSIYSMRDAGTPAGPVAP